jgi:hypothetical protein
MLIVVANLAFKTAPGSKLKLLIAVIRITMKK